MDRTVEWWSCREWWKDRPDPRSDFLVIVIFLFSLTILYSKSPTFTWVGLFQCRSRHSTFGSSDSFVSMIWRSMHREIIERVILTLSPYLYRSFSPISSFNRRFPLDDKTPRESSKVPLKSPWKSRGALPGSSCKCALNWRNGLSAILQTTVTICDSQSALVLNFTAEREQTTRVTKRQKKRNEYSQLVSGNSWWSSAVGFFFC